MEGKFFGSKLNTVLLLILIVLVGVAIYIMFQNTEVYLSVFQKEALNEKIDLTQPPIVFKDGMLGNKDDLISFSIVPYTKVHGILSYRGVIKGGYFFEGNILINILDSNKNILMKSNAVAKTDWMTSGPVSFEGNIDFTSLKKGAGYFEIHNDNASGLPENDKFVSIPIVIE
ncbi:MAG: Gmad2 immunoglobulin-like domain-containing protein [Candidatus Paceibacterota bacterium]